MRYGEMTDEQRKRYAAEIARKRAAGYPEYNYVALLEARVFELEARVFEHEKTDMPVIVTVHPDISTEQWAKLSQQMADYTASPQRYMLVPCSVYELEAEVDRLRGALRDISDTIRDGQSRDLDQAWMLDQARHAADDAISTRGEGP